MDLEKLFLFRYLCILPVVSSLIGSILMFVIGSVKTLQAFFLFFHRFQDFDDAAVSRWRVDPLEDLGVLAAADLAHDLVVVLGAVVLFWWWFSTERRRREGGG